MNPNLLLLADGDLTWPDAALGIGIAFAAAAVLIVLIIRLNPPRR